MDMAIRSVCVYRNQGDLCITEKIAAMRLLITAINRSSIAQIACSGFIPLSQFLKTERPLPLLALPLPTFSMNRLAIRCGAEACGSLWRNRRSSACR